MRRLLFALILGLCLAQPLLAYESPGKPAGFVNDFAGILTSEEKAGLENKIGNFERPAGVEMAVVTVPTLGDETVEGFAVKLFEEWGIGKAKVDNGLLFLIASNDREARIEVGYGLEPVVTDAASSVIMRNIIVPEFAGGNYYEGIDKGVDALIALVEGDPEMAQYVADNQVSEETAESAGAVASNVIFFIFVIILIIIISRKGGGGFLTGLLLGGMRGDYRGGSGRGGGFGGFGGGRSGGGGVSGKW